MVHGHLAKKVDGGSDSPTAPSVVSAKGKQLIQTFEGLRLESYYCSSGILTIGVGHTGPDVYEGMTITRAVAYQLLADDLSRFEDGICRQIEPLLTQNQFDALVSWSFNVGLGASGDSTLRRRLNAGENVNLVISEELPRWDKGPDGPVLGLTRRREAEVKLATTGVFP